MAVEKLEKNGTLLLQGLFHIHKGGAKRYAEEVGVDLLGEVPIIQSIMDGGDTGRPGSEFDERVSEYYAEIADKVVEKLPSEC